MKKVLVVIALIALAVLPVCAKSNLLSVGLEAGYPAAGITVKYDIDSKWDGYATAGFNYAGKAITLALGGEYEATELKIDSVKLPVLVGLQVVPTLSLEKVFDIKALATAGLSYDFSIDDFDFTAYIRGGAGLGIAFGDAPSFAFSGALGCVYNF